MKLVVFGLILICCNVWAAEKNVTDKYASDLIEGFLKRFKDVLKTGSDKIGIPVLDPYNSDKLEFNVNEETIKLDALLTNVKVNGLSEYDIINGDFKLDLPNVLLNVQLSWPRISASTGYRMNGKIDMFEIYGDGGIKFAARGLAFKANVTLEIEGGIIKGYLKVKDIKLELSLTSLDLTATGLYNNEELSRILSAIISDMAPQLIGEEIIADKISLFVGNQLDSFLANKTLSDLLDLISNTI
ncbi:hypothetical protein PUN28_014602 [Cardiocondyla obscurior]|uniref:Uncharacterized protein n=1 Tax=Cardiocondyla obscurior TaxID=286306 RepID=A0AAW2F2M1_9HYME